MNLTVVVPLIAGALGLICLVLLFISLKGNQKSDFRNLMASPGRGSSQTAELREKLQNDQTGEEFERIKDSIRKKTPKSSEPTLQEKMFRAGMFSEQQKKDYRRTQLLLPIVATALGVLIGIFVFGTTQMILLSTAFGAILGFYIPFKILERRTKARSEDILFFLPLVIEQISIGVSSSLDIGPCLMRVVQMADERDSHNPVTELLRYCQFHIKSGVGMEEALTEVGRLSGNVDLKHAFMALSQVAKFGGEISKQLQELADAVGVQREVKIEEKIKKLELEATAPVALVFFGYLIILLIGFGLQIITAL